MTPAVWLAVLLLGWVIVGGIWQAVDKPVEKRYKSRFYLLASSATELALVFLALSVLGAATWLFWVAGAFAVVALIGLCVVDLDAL